MNTKWLDLLWHLCILLYVYISFLVFLKEKKIMKEKLKMVH